MNPQIANKIVDSYYDISFDKLVKMPTVDTGGDNWDWCDIYLTSKERDKYGLMWIQYCCVHLESVLLTGAPVTIHGRYKRIKNQGVINLARQHKKCDYLLFPFWHVYFDPIQLLRHCSTVEYSYFFGHQIEANTNDFSLRLFWRGEGFAHAECKLKDKKLTLYKVLSPEDFNIAVKMCMTTVKNTEA